MKVIVPMAGAGKRLRPHTLLTPKPLLPVAGKPIVQRLVEDIVAISDQKVDEIAYVTGRFGEEAENHLRAVAEKLGARGTIHYQDQPLGTAHAIRCAAEALEGPVTVAFADTLFRADFRLDTSKDGVLWVQKIEDPRAFGVVIVNEDGNITEFREKPQEFVSDLAMIGIYWFRDGAWLKRELDYLVDNDLKTQGEYQLPDALRNMMKQGARFAPGTVDHWMDCGNKEAMVDTNTSVLNYLGDSAGTGSDMVLDNSRIIAPCYIGKGVKLVNSTVGPCVSVGDGCTIESSEIAHSIIGHHTRISGVKLDRSMIGSFVEYRNDASSISLGDYSTFK
jgi:glucose-1-phosphate thymidylyltransferase